MFEASSIQNKNTCIRCFSAPYHNRKIRDEREEGSRGEMAWHWWTKRVSSLGSRCRMLGRGCGMETPKVTVEAMDGGMLVRWGA